MIERVERRAPAQLVIVFGHLYVCVRHEGDHGGWSYRAELVLDGASNVIETGNLDETARGTKDGGTYVPSGEVIDAQGLEVDPLRLLLGVPARSFWIHQVGDAGEFKLSAEIESASLVLLEALERIEDCYVTRAAAH